MRLLTPHAMHGFNVIVNLFYFGLMGGEINADGV